MELEPSFEYDTTLMKPTNFDSNLNSLIERMPFILEIYNSAYVNYNMAPTNQEYQNALLNAKNNIMSTNGTLFALSNDIENNIHGSFKRTKRNFQRSIIHYVDKIIVPMRVWMI
jgi:hypothetical protein